MNIKQIVALTCVVSIVAHFQFAPVAYSSVSRSPHKEYERALNAVNRELNDSIHFSGCTGANLALSCGNSKCEADQGEDSMTCPNDCAPAPVQSYNSQVFCYEVKDVLQPQNYLEVQNIVRQAAASNTHIRVIGRAHTTNSQICTDGVIISTQNLNHVLGIEDFEGHKTVVVEPGISEGDLTEWLHDNGWSLGYGLVGYRGISIGGMIGTGAHGSSAKHSSLLSSAIQSVLVVTPTRQLQEFSEGKTDPETFKALRANLGMLGVVVQLRLKVRPQFNLHNRITFESEKKILGGNNALDLVRNCDFGQIHWFPNAKKIMRTCGMETSQKADPQSNNVYLSPNIPNALIKPYKLAFHYGACNPTFNALYENFRFLVSRILPPMMRENKLGRLVYSTDVIGPSHRMISSELSLSKETLIVRDWEVAIPESQIPSALESLSKYVKKHKLALPITGFYLRFTPVEETTLIANSAAGQNFIPGTVAMFIEFPSYHPIGFTPENQKEYDEQFAGMLRMLIAKHHGRAHLGKNDQTIFAYQKSLGGFGNSLNRFQRVVENFDPFGLFSNDFSSSLLGSSSKD